jgi:polyisoprenoid-binding protein YceI
MKKLFALMLFSGAVALFSCKESAGEKAEVSDAGQVEAQVGDVLPVNAATSVINWEGTKPTGTHVGTINITEGSVIVNDGKVSGGSFNIDMNSIVTTDLDGDMKANLENHLKGFADGKEDHFFNVAKYPTAKFELTKVVSLDGDAEANSTVYGNLTIRDITKEIGFRANINANGDQVTVSTPQFTIDRTQWGVNYGSKSIFDNLGDKFVNDEIGLKINLQAGKLAM